MNYLKNGQVTSPDFWLQNCVPTFYFRKVATLGTDGDRDRLRGEGVGRGADLTGTGWGWGQFLSPCHSLVRSGICSCKVPPYRRSISRGGNCSSLYQVQLPLNPKEGANFAAEVV